MLFFAQWAVSQILSYGLILWLVFAGTAGVAAFRGRWAGIVVGQTLIAVMVLDLDILYQGHHAQDMDLDIVFDFGVLARVLLINTALLPISGIVLWLSYHKELLAFWLGVQVKK